MIQRIQSLYLLLTTMLSLLFLRGSILSFSIADGSAIQLNFNGIYKASELVEKNWIVTIFIVLIPLLSLLITLIYKKRALQLKLTKILIFLILGFILALTFYGYSVTAKYDAAITPGVKTAIPLIQLVLSYLAYRGIRKDDNLVKSYDRLR